MNVFTTNLTIADGQVATTATLVTTGSCDRAVPLDVKFCNVGGQDETLILTVSRNGGTARRLKRVVLAANEEFKLGGLPLNKSDRLLAMTSNAASIDYVVSIAAPHTPYTEETFDDSGRKRTASYLGDQLDSALSINPT